MLCIVLLGFAGFIIPDPQVPEPKAQMRSINGNTLKYDDHLEVEHFIRSIKKFDGYLCLGTSESTTLKDGNYQDYLNNDQEIASRFTALAGAGRSCGVHVPWMMRHRDELAGLKLIYLINPVYWRTDLNRVDLTYGNRYHNPMICNNAGTRENFVAHAYLEALPSITRIVFSLDYCLRKVRYAYFRKLRVQFGSQPFDEDFKYISKKKKDLTDFDHFGKVNLGKIDTVHNALHSFPSRTSSQRIDINSDYRYSELQSFIEFSNSVGMEVTYVIGPYNQRFMTNDKPKTVKQFKQTTDRIREILEESQSTYVDATDISNVAGTFNDYQHHSSYGAYLIYEKLKPFVK